MKKFKNIITEEEYNNSFGTQDELSERSIVFCWGRFNPPTIGHQMVFRKAEELAKAKNANFRIYTSQTQDNDKSPLSYDQKIYFLRRYFPKYSPNLIKNDEIKNLRNVLESIIEFGYTKGWLIVGEDRVINFQKQMNTYYSDRIDVKVVSAGKRNNSGGIKSVSGSLLRDYVKRKDFKSFVKYSPRNVDEKILEDVFHEIRRIYGVSHQTKEAIELSRTPERERFHSGEFKKGDYILVNDSVGEIESIGANYVNVCLLEDNKIIKAWPSDIVKI